MPYSNKSLMRDERWECEKKSYKNAIYVCKFINYHVELFICRLICLNALIESLDYLLKFYTRQAHILNFNIVNSYRSCH